MRTTRPNIHTYHCICGSLLIASTHTLSTLPRRSTPILDHAVILPISPLPLKVENEANSLPPEGWTDLLGVQRDKKDVVIRREDGFEKRVCWKCLRCRLVVGYEVLPEVERSSEEGKAMVLYVLPNGMMSTEFMVNKDEKSIAEGDVDVVRPGVSAWE